MGENNVSPNRHYDRPISLPKGRDTQIVMLIEAVTKKTKKSGVFRDRGIIGERRLGVKIGHFKVFPSRRFPFW